MKIVIFSDIHDNLVNLKNCLSWCRENDIEAIFCCGDVTNIDTINCLVDNFEKDIYMVRGNADSFDDEQIKNKYKNINYFGRLAVFDIENFKVGLCHEPYLIDKLVEIESELDLVFFGHTHKPWIDDKNGLKTINPGTLGGMFMDASYCFWNSKKGELKLNRFY